MYYARDMPLVPSSGWGRCDDSACPGKKSRKQAFGYLADRHDNTRTTIMTQIDGRWVRNGRKKIVLMGEDGSS